MIIIEFQFELYFGFYLMDMLNIKIVKNLRKKGGKSDQFLWFIENFL